MKIAQEQIDKITADIKTMEAMIPEYYAILDDLHEELADAIVEHSEVEERLRKELDDLYNTPIQ